MKRMVFFHLVSVSVQGKALASLKNKETARLVLLDFTNPQLSVGWT